MRRDVLQAVAIPVSPGPGLLCQVHVSDASMPCGEWHIAFVGHTSDGRRDQFLVQEVCDGFVVQPIVRPLFVWTARIVELIVHRWRCDIFYELLEAPQVGPDFLGSLTAEPA